MISEIIRKRYAIIYVIAFAVLATGMALCHRLSMATLKGLVLAAVAIKGLLDDLKSREVPDSVPVCLLIAGLIDVHGWQQLVNGAIGAAIIFVPLFIYLMIRPNGGFGGADMKIAAAFAFVNGTLGGLIGLAAGLLVAIIVTLIAGSFRKSKKADREETPEPAPQGFAAVPYISLAGLLIYMLF